VSADDWKEFVANNIELKITLIDGAVHKVSIRNVYCRTRAVKAADENLLLQTEFKINHLLF